MAAKLTGTLYTYQSHSLYVGALIASARHQHHAGQVMWVPEGVVVDDENGTHHVTTYVVPPNRFHSHGAAAAAAVLWVDRDDLEWDQALEQRDLPCQMPAALRAHLGKPLTREGAGELARALLERVAPRGLPECAPRHPAVLRMCALLDTTASARDVSMTQLARQSGLSLRQLRHHFTEELGINRLTWAR